jgi:hypothetical protein
MKEKSKVQLPRWLFAIISVGAFIACGIYLGMMRIEGLTTPDLIRSMGYFVVGLVMFWGLLSNRQRPD